VLTVLPHAAAVKVTMHDGFTTVTDDASMIMVEGKDTWRLKQHGAEKVVWITAQERDLEEALHQAWCILAEWNTIVIEGNSILRFLTPDLAFFVCDEALLSAGIKQSRIEAMKKAHLIIHNLRENRPPHSSDVERACRKINGAALFVEVCLTDSEKVQTVVCDALQKKNIPANLL